MSDLRLQQLTSWVQKTYDDPSLVLDVVSADASFRRYFRFNYRQQSLIAVDAPPDKENSQRFKDLSLALLSHNVNVPTVLQFDGTLGFMVLNDFGDELLMPLAKQSPLVFDRHTDITPLPQETLQSAFTACISLYQKMLAPLFGVMKVKEIAGDTLDVYDTQKLMAEMQLMEDWFFPEYLAYALSDQERALIHRTKAQLLTTALAQPQVGVHRDYHSRNLMILPDQTVGVIDFQDAVVGPLTYDLVSLLRDCYLVFPEQVITRLVTDFYQQCMREQLISSSVTVSEFVRWFDWMGLQRHIKVLGIFARLSFRDGKDSYLADIPRVFDYVTDVAGRYEELQEFQQWMLNKVKPMLVQKDSERRK